MAEHFAADSTPSRWTPADRIPLPPADVDVFTTCCDYCSVGCGYTVYRWPMGEAGGTAAGANAYGAEFPRAPLSGAWASPNQHNVVIAGGSRQQVLVVPDANTQVVNLHGDHSIRGGCLAQKCYNPETATQDRLHTPLLRVNGALQPVSWDVALDIVATISKYVVAQHGVSAWAQKQYAYQYFENTYALTKFALGAIRTPCFAEQHGPSYAEVAPGLRDTGIDEFSAAYEDWEQADTLFISGTDPFETKTVLWNEWIMRGIARGQKIIFATPRKTTGPAYAEKLGGLHLWLTPGTDTILHVAIARVILEQGWEDAAWIAQWTASTWEPAEGSGGGVAQAPTMWPTLQTNGFPDYKQWVLAQPESELAFAAQVCGVPEGQILRAAELLAKPRVDGTRPKASFAIEKGCYSSNNYTNTASIASLGLLCGAGNRPGRMVSRLGGHQLGACPGGQYPIEESPEHFTAEHPKPLDVDRHVQGGHVRFAYVVGTTWIDATPASTLLDEAFRRLTAENPNQITSIDPSAAIEVLKRRVDSGGMVVVNQEIYLRRLGSEYADVVLPAATWGECDLTRCNAERRLRLYQQFADPPGEARPDWWIVAEIAQRMGFEGFAWPDANAVFEESAAAVQGTRTDYFPLVQAAKLQGARAHDLLKARGTTGIQCPIRDEGGELVGTVRLHDSTLQLAAQAKGGTGGRTRLTTFSTRTGKANFLKSPWNFFADYFEFMKPRGDELWITNGRINEIWQSGFDDVLRRPYISQRWPANFLELHPEDAKVRGIASGDLVEAACDRVPVQTGAPTSAGGPEGSFARLRKDGHMTLQNGAVQAVAVVMPVPRPGVAFMYFLHPDGGANPLVPRVPDPLTGTYRHKLAVGTVRKVGESAYKHSLTHMSFGVRAII